MNSTEAETKKCCECGNILPKRRRKTCSEACYSIRAKKLRYPHVFQPKTCTECKNSFIATRRKVTCSPECKKLRIDRLHQTNKETSSICKIKGCNQPGYAGFGLCTKHYSRHRLKGTTNDPKPPNYRILSDGYIKVKSAGHPLANKLGWVREHRKVLYDAIGPGPHKCHWCDKIIPWEKIVVDHLNETKSDNNLSNLVASCDPCNFRRGSCTMFMLGIDEQRLNEFIGIINELRKNKI